MRAATDGRVRAKVRINCCYSSEASPMSALVKTETERVASMVKKSGAKAE
jgi:hypothetical protein